MRPPRAPRPPAPPSVLSRIPRSNAPCWRFRNLWWREAARTMKLLAALLLACSIRLAAQTQPPDLAALQRWAGCYDLRVAHEDSAKQIWGKLPRRFQLLLERAHHKRIPNLMVG